MRNLLVAAIIAASSTAYAQQTTWFNFSDGSFGSATTYDYGSMGSQTFINTTPSYQNYSIPNYSLAPRPLYSGNCPAYNPHLLQPGC